MASLRSDSLFDNIADTLGEEMHRAARGRNKGSTDGRKVIMNIRSAFASLPPAAALLGVNTIPALGWLRETWSAETTMILYYLETAAMVVLVGLMVRLAVPAVDEHGERITARRNRLARDYWLVMGGFALAIGVFMAVILLLFLDTPVPWRAVGAVMGIIIALQLFAYGWEAWRMWPLNIADAERLVNRDMGRIAILHLGVLFGIFLAMVRSDWFVWPFFILKTISDMGRLLAPALGLPVTGFATKEPGD